MKKFGILVLMLGMFGAILSGCGKKTVEFVYENMSEKTEVYFYGETTEVYASISSGKREETYLMNGISERKVDFALLAVNFYNEALGDVINVTLKIGEKETTVSLERNSINNTYMVDLEKRLLGDESISMDYMEEHIEFANVSKDFKIGANKAIEIASKELSKFIMKEKKMSSLNSECYLRVLDKRANNFDEMFWVFTVVNIKNENYSVVISTVDGSVLSKSE